jgi:hypothetical protein
MTNSWQALNNTPPFSVDTMLLLTDASIMYHELESSNWHRLVPDAICRTFNHSTMAVATGKKVVHTYFHVPHMVPVGHYELTVIANGIQSQSVKVRVKP